MDAMPTFQALAAAGALDIAFRVVRTYITPDTFRRAIKATGDGSAAPLTVEDGDSPGGCVACELHARAAEARSLLDGLAAACRENDEVPAGLGGTIPLAQAKLQEAAAHAATIAGVDVRFTVEALTVQRELGDAAAMLTGDLSPADIAEAQRQADGAWRSTYALVRKMFTPPAGDGNQDPFLEWLSEVRSGDTSDDEAIQGLRSLLRREDDDGPDNERAGGVGQEAREDRTAP